MNDDIALLIDRADLDGLIRLIDASCESRNWADVLTTRDMCRSATRTGRQVWPIATLCEYRLALHAPAQWACRVVGDDASQFSIGPLTEVIAQNHSWSEIGALLSHGPHREIVAHERAIRGESIDSTDLNPAILDLPFHLCDWEPEYIGATYSDDGVTAPCPTDTWVHDWSTTSASENPIVRIEDEETESALRSLLEPWTAASAGRAHCLVVEGGLESLTAAMDRTSLHCARLTSQQALNWLAWCGASAGAHGRRRGSAAGRFNAWWTLAALGDLDWDEANTNGTLSFELDRLAARIEWFRIESDRRHSFELSLAAVDETENLAFGLFGHDDTIT